MKRGLLWTFAILLPPLLLCDVAPVYGQAQPVTVPRARDTDRSNWLELKAGSDLTSDRTLTFTTGDASRALTLSADVALNQSLLTTSSPAFLSATFSPTDTIGFTLKYPDDGTTYNGEGTVDAWRWVVGRGAQDTNYQVPGGRLDHGFGWSYNVTANGVRARSDEIGILNNQELHYPIPTSTTFNCSGAPVYTAGTYPTGGYSTVTAATTPFTAAMVNTTGLKFSGSTVGYPVVAYTSSSVIRVLGDCSGRTTTGVTIYARGTEKYQQIWHIDDRVVRHEDTSINTYTQAITKTDRFTNLTWQTPVASPVTILTLDEPNGLTVSVGNIYLGTNAKGIYGKTIGGSVASMLTYDAQGTLGIGQNSLTNGVRIGGPGLLSSDDTVGILMGAGSGTAGGSQGTAGYLQFVGAKYGADGIRPRMYTDYDHIWMRLPGQGESSVKAELVFGPSSAADAKIYRSASATLATNANICIATAGKGLQIKQGADAKSNTVTLSGNTEVTVTNSSVTANSIIDFQQHAAAAVANLANYGEPILTDKVAGSFKVASTNNADTRVITYIITEPAP